MKLNWFLTCLCLSMFAQNSRQFSSLSCLRSLSILCFYVVQVASVVTKLFRQLSNFVCFKMFQFF